MTAADNEELDALAIGLEAIAIVQNGRGMPNQAATVRLAIEQITALRARVAEAEHDMREAAGPLLTDLPEPGTPMAKLLSANVLLRRRAELAESQLQQVKADAERYRWLRDTPLWCVELNQWSADRQGLWNTRFSSPYGADPGHASLDAAIDAARRNDGTA